MLPASSNNDSILSSDINLEDMATLTGLSLLREVAELAQTCAIRYELPSVLIVIHTIINMNTINTLGLWSNIKESIQNILTTFPNVEIGIENVIPLNISKKTGKFSLSNNWGFDNVEIVQRLRNELNTTKIGIVLDICHAQMSEMYINAIIRLR